MKRRESIAGLGVRWRGHLWRRGSRVGVSGGWATSTEVLNEVDCLHEVPW
jgi:hypothetical protein